jgi:allantoate deiminase
MLGSKATAGAWSPEYLDATDAGGVSLREALSQFGLDPARVGAARRESRELIGYLEAHIEQGPELEAAGLPLGVVSSICGARRFALTVLGEARHAGSTPYPRRRDALIGASHAVIDIERIARKREVIATVGKLQAYPGADNVVCGRAEFSLDLRAEHDADRDAAWSAISAAIQKRCQQRYLRFAVRETHCAAGVSCAPWLQRAVTDGIRGTGQARAPVLFSRPGHDAMVLARITDVGMIFVRCADGISHHPAEAVQAPDVAAAADAFEAAVRAIAGG